MTVVSPPERHVPKEIPPALTGAAQDKEAAVERRQRRRYRSSASKESATCTCKRDALLHVHLRYCTLQSTTVSVLCAKPAFCCRLHLHAMLEPSLQGTNSKRGGASGKVLHVCPASPISILSHTESFALY